MKFSEESATNNLFGVFSIPSTFDIPSKKAAGRQTEVKRFHMKK